MIINCNCGEKKFNLPDGSIPATGRLVQCGFCEKRWTQYPLKQTPEIVKTPPIVTKAAPKKKTQKRKGPAPYSKEYMQEKKIRLVVDKKNIILADEKLDLTIEIMQALNA